MTKKTIPTYQIKLYLSGPIEVAKQLLRRECLRLGLCVTIEPTTFIYTGGEETGYIVGLLNYPRFPAVIDELKARAESIMLQLIEETNQHSGLMVTPTQSTWVTRRESNEL